MHSDLSVYGLLYVDPGDNRHVNISSRQNSIDVYLRCAANCSRSFRRQGTTFKIITNNQRLLTEHLARLDISDLEIAEHRFTLAVPPRIPFYSAHFKLELYGAFGSGEYGEYVALIDIDTLLLRSLPTSEHLAVYDISDQVFPRYGQDVVLRDLEIVAGQPFINGRWYGGEFLMGHSSQFRRLASFIDFCWPRYLQNIATVHHLGDEMVLSAALNLYSETDRLVDYGAAGNVARWWSSRTYNKQVPFSDVRDTALLHLPADKLFLARYNPSQPATQALLEAYGKYASRKLLIRSIIPTLDLFSSHRKKFMPRLHR
jgi:hypothetical protein